MIADVEVSAKFVTVAASTASCALSASVLCSVTATSSTCSPRTFVGGAPFCVASTSSTFSRSSSIATPLSFHCLSSSTISSKLSDGFLAPSDRIPDGAGASTLLAAEIISSTSTVLSALEIGSIATAFSTSSTKISVYWSSDCIVSTSSSFSEAPQLLSPS